MTLPLRIAFSILLVVAVIPCSVANQWSGHIGVTDQYNRRGLKVSDDGLIANALLEYNFQSGFYVGAWLADVNFRSDLRGDVQFDYFVGYAFSLSDPIVIDTSIVRYTNPRSEVDYDWTEWVTRLHYKQRSTLTIGINDNWIRRGKTAKFIEFTYRHPLPLNVITDFTVGYVDSDKIISTDYSYYEVGLNTSYEQFRFRASLTGADDDIKGLFGKEIAGNRWTFSIDWAF